MASPLRLITPLALLSLPVLLPANASAEDKWIEVRSAHFTVYTPASEREARKIADQFEQIRALFHAAFSTLRTDPGQPVVILAVKNEKGMKELLPEQWEVKGHLHAAGLYQQGFDKHYVLLQLDAEGNNPYHALYHEYTHALLHLNFANIPAWLDEGVAEYLGNAIIGDKESQIGIPDPGNLYILQQNRLLPIETLLAVDHSSPYYNESNRASVFYAESWALVHYLFISPEARQKQLLSHFLNAWSASHDQLEAARQTFGDLKKFGDILDVYVRQRDFYHLVVKNSPDAVDKQSASRSLSPAEVEALRGDFFVHHNRLEAGKPLIEEAVKAEPTLPFAHAALAYYDYRVRDMQATAQEAKEAIRLGDTGFFPPYLEAVSMMQGGMVVSDAAGGRDSLQQANALLDQSAKLNPNFAPTFEALANVYATYPDKQKAAVNAMIQAMKLDPTDLHYAVHLTHLLLSDNSVAQAKIMADKIAAAAATPQEREMAQSMLRLVAERQGNPGNSQSISTPGNSAGTLPGTVIFRRDADANVVLSGTPNPSAGTQQRMGIGVEGVLTDVDCGKSPEVTLDLVLDGGEVSYHITDVAKLQLTAAANHPAPACTQWSGRRVMLWFTPSADPKVPAEVSKVVFE